MTSRLAAARGAHRAIIACNAVEFFIVAYDVLTDAPMWRLWLALLWQAACLVVLAVSGRALHELEERAHRRQERSVRPPGALYTTTPDPDQCPVCGMTGLWDLARDDPDAVVPYGPRWHAHHSCAEWLPYEPLYDPIDTPTKWI